MWGVIHLVVLLHWVRARAPSPSEGAPTLPDIGSFALPDPIVWIDGEAVIGGAYEFRSEQTLSGYLKEAGLDVGSAAWELHVTLEAGSAVHVTVTEDPAVLQVNVATLPGNVSLLFGYPISLDGATSADLQFLPHVGPKMAQKILSAHETGEWRTLNDLDEIKGVGPHRMAQWRKLLALDSQVRSFTVAIKNPGVR